MASASGVSLKQLEKPINQLIDKYLASDNHQDVALSGLLNWFSITPRDGTPSAFKNSLLARNDFVEKFIEVYEQAASEQDNAAGRVDDFVILSVANDLVAQIEMAANFRRLKVSHHFAKSRYNLVDSLGKGTHTAKKAPVLRQYTLDFLQNAVTGVNR
jgi:hypothetical protein